MVSETEIAKYLRENMIGHNYNYYFGKNEGHKETCKRFKEFLIKKNRQLKNFVDVCGMNYDIIVPPRLIELILEIDDKIKELEEVGKK